MVPFSYSKQNVYLSVKDTENHVFRLAADRNLECAAGNTASVEAAVPNGGAGPSQLMTYTFSTPYGSQDLGVVNVLINRYLDGRAGRLPGVCDIGQHAGAGG